jgi:1,4-dihydroxy-6-naphthoate synthase
MILRIGISPCPNDTFIFDALANHKIDLQSLSFDFVLEDVQTLNEMALQGELDVVKISYANYFQVAEQYQLLRAGGALGFGVGPLLVKKKEATVNIEANQVIALPGQHTTAHFLFSHFYPNHNHKKFMVFSEVEEAVLSGEVDAGVLIHENRFTYAERGMQAISDLGSAWEKETKLPIPLGGIAVKRALKPYHKILNDLIRESLALSWSHYPNLSPYVVQHAQEMNENVMRQHIELYVNDYSMDIGETGLAAVEQMKHYLAKTKEDCIFIAL